MALFKRKKKELKKTIDDPMDSSSPPSDEDPLDFDDIEEDDELLDDSLIEYEDTLYTKDIDPNEKSEETQEQCWQRQHWETPKEIEQQIDTMDKSMKKHKDHKLVSGVETKVDQLIKKSPQKTKMKKSIKKNSDVPEGFEKVVHKKTGLTYYKRK